MKINGFTRHFHLLQTISYIVYICNLIVFSIITIPLLSWKNQIISGVLFYFSVLLTFLFGFLSTWIDPTDDIVILERQARNEGKIFDTSELEYYCESCDTHVSENSKHCKQCNRCVINFDHHCKWVNNCIGGKNYKYFFALIVSVMANSGVFIAFNYFLTYRYCSNSEDFVQLSILSTNGNLVEMIFLWVLTGMSSILFILDCNLVFFHIWLLKRGISTYEYILRKREKKKAKSKSQNLLENDQEKFENPNDEESEVEKHSDLPQIENNENKLTETNPPRNSLTANNPSSGSPKHKNSLNQKSSENCCCSCLPCFRKKNKVFFQKPIEDNNIFANDDLPRVSQFLMENVGCLVDIADSSATKLRSPTEKQTSLPQEKEFLNEKTERTHLERTSDNLKNFSQQGSIKEKEKYQQKESITQKSNSLTYSENEKKQKIPFEFGIPNEKE